MRSVITFGGIMSKSQLPEWEQTLGRLDLIETGLRRMIRTEPLEIAVINVNGQKIRIPIRRLIELSFAAHGV